MRRRHHCVPACCQGFVAGWVAFGFLVGTWLVPSVAEAVGTGVHVVAVAADRSPVDASAAGAALGAHQPGRARVAAGRSVARVAPAACPS